MRRKPKRLDTAPALFQRGGAPVVLQSGGDGDPAATPPAAAPAPLSTGDTSELRSLDELLTETPDPAVHAAARDLALRLWLRRPVPEQSTARGSRTVARPFRDDAEELDVERTVEMLIERQRDVSTFRDVEDRDVQVRSRLAARRAVALIVDVSGSMKGEKANIVGAVVGALAAQLRRDELSVVAFWKDCALLTEPDRVVDPRRVLDDLLRLPRKGLTNVHAGIAAAQTQLARSSARERFAVLLSDCVHNAGPDPREAAAAVPRLHVLLETDGEHDAWLARELASVGRGRLARARHHRDVALAVNAIFAAG